MTENTRDILFTKESAEALLSTNYGPLDGRSWVCLDDQYCGDDANIISKLVGHFDVPLARLQKASFYLFNLSTGEYELAGQFGKVPVVTEAPVPGL